MFGYSRRSETEFIRKAVMKVIDTLKKEDFIGAFQMLLEQYKDCVGTGGDYYEGY